MGRKSKGINAAAAIPRVACNERPRVFFRTLFAQCKNVGFGSGLPDFLLFVYLVLTLKANKKRTK